MTPRNPAVFIDRDGTINEEVEFVCTPDELRLIPGAAQAIRKLNVAGLITCVISNQSGVARGYLTEDELSRVHVKLETELLREEARLDRIYYCPHHPSKGRPPYNIHCLCRKPSPGMLYAGEKEFSADLGRSFVVGDRIVDVQVGKAVGARTFLVQTGYGKNALKECTAMGVHPDHIIPSLAEAVEIIVKENGSHA